MEFQNEFGEEQGESIFNSEFSSWDKEIENCFSCPQLPTPTPTPIPLPPPEACACSRFVPADFKTTKFCYVTEPPHLELTGAINKMERCMKYCANAIKRMDVQERLFYKKLTQLEQLTLNTYADNKVDQAKVKEILGTLPKITISQQ